TKFRLALVCIVYIRRPKLVPLRTLQLRPRLQSIVQIGTRIRTQSFAQLLNLFYNFDPIVETFTVRKIQYRAVYVLVRTILTSVSRLRLRVSSANVRVVSVDFLVDNFFDKFFDSSHGIFIAIVVKHGVVLRNYVRYHFRHISHTFNLTEFH